MIDIEALAREAGFSLSVLDCYPPAYYLEPGMRDQYDRIVDLQRGDES